MDPEKPALPIPTPIKKRRNPPIRSQIFYCGFCTDEKPYRKPYKKIYDLRHHIKTVHGVRPHQCKYCPKSFKFKIHLTEHEYKHTGERPFTCDICQKSFYYQRALNSHKKYHEEPQYKCKICFHTFVMKSHLVDHIPTHTGEKFHKCNICGKEFTLKGALKYHKETHLKGKTFKCRFCYRKFQTKRTARDHELDEHGSDRRTIKCSICPRSFVTSRGLQKHVEAIHTNPIARNEKFNLSKCQLCGVICSNYYNLQRHLKLHTENKKLFKCYFCNKDFRVLHNLFFHLYIHTLEKPHKCSICGKPFRQGGELTQHLRTHSTKKWKCYMCDKGFHIRTPGLDNCLRRHLNEFPFKCPTCSKRFSSYYAFLHHKRKHPKVK